MLPGGCAHGHGPSTAQALSEQRAGPPYNWLSTLGDTLSHPVLLAANERAALVEIIKYPHPTLRHKSKPIKRVDAELRRMIAEMFDLMYAADGIGLAGNQVDLPLRIFVVNAQGREDEEAEERVFINPVLERPKGSDEAEEGCLSLPALYAPVKRPKSVVCTSYNIKGEQVTEELDGLLARVVQHETDHLDGVLFIDRLSETAKVEVRDALASFKSTFDGLRDRGEIPGDGQIADRLASLEEKYC